MSIIGMDPPRHVRLRNLISKGFTPRCIGALEPEIRRIAKICLDPLGGSGREFDFQAALSNKLPMDVISAMLGIPDEDRERYRGWVGKGLERDPETGAIPPDGSQGMLNARAMMLALLAEQRARPRNDLMSLLAETTYEDVDGRTKHVTDEEAVAFMGLLAAAGAETTTKLPG
jgi:cytochrome P450